MAIEGLVASKARILEDLLRITAHLHLCLMQNRHDDFEASLDERARKFSELSKIDESLKGTATDQDDLWLRQLKMIEGTDREILNLLVKFRTSLEAEQARDAALKAEIFQNAMVDPRGQSVSVRG